MEGLSKIKSYRDLLVWQKAHRLVIKIYILTRKFPKEELYCLVSQMRRAAISVASNIVEGSSRRTRKDFSNFLITALGSLNELEYQVMLSLELGYITSSEAGETQPLLEEVGRMLNGLINSIRNSDHA